MKKLATVSCSGAAISIIFGLTSPAAAQDTPAGLMEEKTASTGSTDVAAEGFQTAVKDDGATNYQEMTVTAGGLLAAGNARSLSLTAAADYKLRRDQHQLGVAGAANYGQGAALGEKIRRNVENYQGRLRYDYFLQKNLAVFLSVSALNDRFAGLILRMNVDPGLAYYFLDVEKHQLWAELGYDLQHDVRRDDSRTVDDDTVLDKTETRHHGRLFLGYDNKVNKAITFNAGLEYLQGIEPFEDDVTGDQNFQFLAQAGLTSTLAEGFSVGTSIGVKYDNNPLPDVEKTDVLTAVNLVYSLF